MAKIPSRISAPCQCLCSVSPQRPASDRSCLQAVTGAWHTSLRAGWLQALISTCPQTFICHIGLCGGSGFEFPLSIKPARHLDTSFLLPRSTAWASSCEIFRWYVSCSFSLSVFFFLFFFKFKSCRLHDLFISRKTWISKRNARREKLFPVQVYSYNSHKIVEQPRIIII